MGHALARQRAGSYVMSGYAASLPRTYRRRVPGVPWCHQTFWR